MATPARKIIPQKRDIVFFDIGSREYQQEFAPYLSIYDRYSLEFYHNTPNFLRNMPLQEHRKLLFSILNRKTNDDFNKAFFEYVFVYKKCAFLRDILLNLNFDRLFHRKIFYWLVSLNLYHLGFYVQFIPDTETELRNYFGKILGFPASEIPVVYGVSESESSSEEISETFLFKDEFLFSYPWKGFQIAVKKNYLDFFLALLGKAKRLDKLQIPDSGYEFIWKSPEEQESYILSRTAIFGEKEIPKIISRSKHLKNWLQNLASKGLVPLDNLNDVMPAPPAFPEKLPADEEPIWKFENLLWFNESARGRMISRLLPGHNLDLFKSAIELVPKEVLESNFGIIPSERYSIETIVFLKNSRTRKKYTIKDVLLVLEKPVVSEAECEYFFGLESSEEISSLIREATERIGNKYNPEVIGYLISHGFARYTDFNIDEPILLLLIQKGFHFPINFLIGFIISGYISVFLTLLEFDKTFRDGYFGKEFKETFGITECAPNLLINKEWYDLPPKDGKTILLEAIKSCRLPEFAEEVLEKARITL